MKTLPLDVRRRILDAYDKGQSTREKVAARYQVSVGMVKKLLQQRRHGGDIAPQHHRSGRKPVITEAHQRQIRTLLKSKPGLTLAELREATGLGCTLPAIHHALVKMGLKGKKRSAPSSNADKRTGKGRSTARKLSSTGADTKAGPLRRATAASARATAKKSA